MARRRGSGGAGFCWCDGAGFELDLVCVVCVCVCCAVVHLKAHVCMHPYVNRTACYIQAAGGLEDDHQKERNNSYFILIGAAYSTMTSHKKFKNIRSAKALDAKSGGTTSCFDISSYKSMVEGKSDEYTVSGSVGWVNELWSPVAGVPFNQALVKDLMDRRFAAPSRIREGIVIAVPEDVDYDPMEHKGALQAATPLELIHAQILAVERDVNAGDEKVIEEWAVVLNSTHLTFKVLKDDVDILFQQDKLREQMVMQGTAVQHSGLQRIMKVMLSKPMVERKFSEAGASEKRWAEILTKGVGTLAADSEPMTDTFLKQAASVYNKALKHKKVFEAIEFAERYGKNSPFHRVSVIYHIAHCRSGVQATEELFETIVYHLRRGNLDSSAFSLEKVAPKNGKKGTLDMLVSKLKFRDFMLDSWLGKMDFPHEVKADLKLNVGSLTRYLAFVKNYPGELYADLSWFKDCRSCSRLVLAM